METIELHQAFFWDCEMCGKENFERAIALEMTRDEKTEIFRDMGELESYEELPPEFDIDLLSAPKKVKCKYCGTIFRAIEEGAEDDDTEYDDDAMTNY
tara:strand:- start:591 stop:884 length:294 start_codon:yes stop_codon:yes gene_type:complete